MQSQACHVHTMSNDEIFYDAEKERAKKTAEAIRVIIEGKVKRAGMRTLIRQKAIQHNVDGWVRNRMNGSIEALFSGSETDVREMIKVCYQGTPFAIIKRIKQFPQANSAHISKGFYQLPTI